MQNLKETAETVQGSMSFMQDFLQKKYAWGIVFFVLFLAGFISSVVFYNNGVKTGKENAVSEVKSLRGSIRNDSLQMRRMRLDYNELQAKLDSCNKNSNSSNLEELVNRKLEEAERLQNILKRQLKSDEKLNKDLKSVLK